MGEENNKGKGETKTKEVENLVILYRRKIGKQTINGESVDLTGGEIMASYPRAKIDLAGGNIISIRVNGKIVLSPKNTSIERQRHSYKYNGL